MSYDYFDSLETSTSKERYMAKLSACGLQKCPYKLPAGIWQNNPLQWPEVAWPDIYCYLVETPGVYTKEAMKNYKSCDAYVYLTSGWVQTVYHMKIEGSNNVLLKADVRPSQRMNDEPHHPWIVCRKQGTVLAAHCDCMAGLGESCSHVAAVMFKVEAAVRHGYTKLSCTEEPCKWNECFMKKVEAGEISDINFYKDKSKEKHKKLKQEITVDTTPATDEQQQKYLDRLSKRSTKSIVLSTYDTFCEPFVTKRVPHEPKGKLPVDMRTLYKEGATSASQEIMQEAIRKIAVTQQEIARLEEHTKRQSSSPIWHEMRIGRITASVAHSVMHTNPDVPAVSLMEKICMPQVQNSTTAMSWGKEKEPVALETFSKAYGECHSNLQVVPTGMRISENYPFLGASPDSLATCTCCGTCVVEVKCPFKYRDSSDEDMYSDPKCCLTREYTLKPTHSYFTQMQMQMFVFNVSFGQFVHWTPQYCTITTVLRDDMFINNMLTHLSKVWHEHILPELLTRKIENKPTEVCPAESDDEKPYCYCQTPSSGRMVLCDNPDCSIEWFHLTCLKRKTVPRGMWFCKNCKKANKKTKK